MLSWNSSLLLLLCSAVSSINARIGRPIGSREMLTDLTSREAHESDLTACDEACAVIASRLPASLFYGKTGNFEFWDTKQSDITPACRVEPSSSEEVSFVLKTLIDTECHFAIKSGGHDRAAGSSNADAGVTIDLIKLKQVTISEDKKSVKLGAGLRWEEAYSALEKEGLLVVGGRISDVGVGGLILGGGMSFHANRYGWACDNVLSYDIVMPNTSIESVSQSSDPDLYRSLRGAGASNFGIVTSFTMETFVPPNPAGIWGGNKLFSWDKVPELLNLDHKFATQSMDLDPDVAMWHAYAYLQAPDSWYASQQLRHAAHADESTWPEIFQGYETIEGVPNTTNIAIKPLSNVTVEIAGPNRKGGRRNLWGTFTYHPSIELDQRIIDIFVEESTPVKNMSDFVPIAGFQPLSRFAIQKMTKRGGNALGIAQSGEEGPLTILNTGWEWSAPSDDDRSYAAWSRIMVKIERAIKEMGVGFPYKYINYAHESQDVWSGLGEENLKELRRVQRKVDPEGLFAKGGLGGGYFKLNELPEGKGWKGHKKSDGGRK